jgi:hypothetical protein
MQTSQGNNLTIAAERWANQKNEHKRASKIKSRDEASRPSNMENNCAKDKLTLALGSCVPQIATTCAVVLATGLDAY